MPSTFPVVRVLLALLLAALAWGALAEIRCAGLRADIEVIQHSFAKQREQLATAQTREVEKARTEERRTAFRIQENLDAEHRLRLAREASERSAVAAVAGLRDDTATYRAALAALAAADSAPSRECRAAAQTASVCTGLLDQCEGESLEVAGFAERSHAASRTCAGNHRALIPEVP